MNTEWDILISKIRNLFINTAFVQQSIHGNEINTFDFFNELKLLLKDEVILKELEKDISPSNLEDIK